MKIISYIENICNTVNKQILISRYFIPHTKYFKIYVALVRDLQIFSEKYEFTRIAVNTA